MAYTRINVQEPGQGGAELTLSNGVAGGAGTGYKFANDGRTYLYITNTGAGTPTVTIVTGRTVAGRAVEDQAIALTATAGVKDIVHAGPFPKDVYDQPDGSNDVYVYFSGSNETDVRIAAFH